MSDDSRQHFRYRMSGLDVESEVAVPLRTMRERSKFTADVTLRIGDVPEQLDRPLHQGPNWAIDSRSFLLVLPGIGRFLAEEGRRLIVHPAAGVAIDDILVFATGTALSAILYQRGALLLHGSAVVRDGRAFIFCGASGAGKSTLSAALAHAGCAFLSDDLCSIVEAQDGSPLVEPDGRVLRLYPDSIERLALTNAVGPRVRIQVDKFHVVVPGARLAPERPPLAAVYMLGKANAAQPAGVAAMPPLAAAQALLRQSYRRRIALAYSAQGRLAARTAGLLSHIRVYTLHRPRDLARLDETVDALTAHWAGLS